MAARHPLLSLTGLVALVGCLAGMLSVSGIAQSTSGTPKSLLADQLVLEYPPGWKLAGPVRLPGMNFVRPVTLAPGADAAHAGLIAGQLEGTRESPLPASLLALLPSAARGEIVEMTPVQAYRYRLLRASETVELYVFPSAQEDATALACYADEAALLRECRQIVASLTSISPTESLAPNRAFADRLGVLLVGAAREQAASREQLAHATTPATAASAARQLASELDAEARSVSALSPAPTVTAVSPTPMVASAQKALEESLTAAAGAYAALGGAAGSGDAEAYAAASARLDPAQANVKDAIERFELFGFTVRDASVPEPPASATP